MTIPQSDEFAGQTVPAPKNFHPQGWALRASGSLMEPHVYEGDTVFVEPVPPEAGQLAVLYPRDIGDAEGPIIVLLADNFRPEFLTVHPESEVFPRVDWRTTNPERYLGVDCRKVAAGYRVHSVAPGSNRPSETKEGADRDINSEIRSIAAMDFDAVEIDPELKLPTNEEWAGLANPHLIMLRTAYGLLQKSKPELVEAARRLEEHRMAETTAEALTASAKWFRALASLLEAGEARFLAACCVLAQEGGDDPGPGAAMPSAEAPAADEIPAEAA